MIFFYFTIRSTGHHLITLRLKAKKPTATTVTAEATPKNSFFSWLDSLFRCSMNSWE